MVIHNPFFWDTIQLGSLHAHYYFENNLSLQLLPDRIDSGHLPGFGYLLAVCWMFFGKSLIISHLMMLPFLLGIVFQLSKLLKRFFSSDLWPFVLALFLADPTLLAQATLVTPDIPLVFFFLMLINALFEGKSMLKLLAVIGLSLTSMRGWMCAALLFGYELFLTNNFKFSNIRPRQISSILLPYLPGGIIAMAYLIIHYYKKGWIGYHEGSPWAECFAPVDIFGFLRNLIIYSWRLIDFGRIIVWLPIIFGIKVIVRQINSDKNLKSLLVLSACFLILFPFSMLLHKNLLGERYLLPTILAVLLLSSYILFQKTNLQLRTKKMLAIVSVFVLLSGNLIIYPDKIAQSWDSSLAYLPYFELKKQSELYLIKNKIPFNITGTCFPATSNQIYTDLDTQAGLSPFTVKNLALNEYFLYSNIMNDVTDEEYTELFNNWSIITNHQRLGIKMILFKRPD